MLCLNNYFDKEIKLFHFVLAFFFLAFPISNEGVQKKDVIVAPAGNIALDSFFDAVRISLLTLRFGLAFKCSPLFSRMSEKQLLDLSALKARTVFRNAYDRVPAYKKFVDTSCETLPSYFQDIPITSKYNYIKKFHIFETLLDGKMPLLGQIDTSTGTTGDATVWVRSHQEMENVKYWLDVASKSVLGQQSYIFCNMFDLGPWVSGMTCAYSVFGKQMIVSIGTNAEVLYGLLEKFGKNESYVISGYPTHMKKLVENAPFDLSEYNIMMVVGGEALTLNVRNHLLQHGVKKVFSSYGASDLRINVGQNTDFEQELQKICKENSDFREELLGDAATSIPSFFRYNPLLDYIEETEDERLIFTDLDLSRISPRVRYDLGDKGKVFTASKIVKLLKKYGYSLRPKINFPLLCLYGRGDEAVIFNGCNIMYDDFELALSKDPLFFENINRCAFNKFENKQLDQQIELWIELKMGKTLEDLGLSAEAAHQKVLEALCEVSEDFRDEIEFVKNNKEYNLLMPQVCIFEYGQSPMVPEGKHYKNKSVYNVVMD